MIREESPDLVRYLAEFDLTLADLRPDQVSMFVAGRNVAQHVQGLEVPTGSQCWEQSDTSLAEKETERLLDLVACDEGSWESRLPADEMDVCVARSVEDLPRLFPIQWVPEEVVPEWFYARLARWELLMPQWQRPGREPRDVPEPSPQHDLVREPVTADAAKLHAYVLLDTSSTMQDHDRRGTVARGLALEFLRRGYNQGARLHLRPFAVEVGALSSGETREDLHAMTRRLISLPNAGQTRIQAALDQAVGDIRREGPCLEAGIMLITDGISRLSENPLAGEKLHTFILGDLFDEQRAAGTISVLRQWSHSFHRIWKHWFAEILAPAWRDCQAAGRLLERLLAEEAASGFSESETARLRRVLENVQFLVQEFKRSLGHRVPMPPDVQGLEAQLYAAGQILGETAEPPGPVPGSRASRPARRPRTYTALAQHPVGVPREGIGFWRYLWQWAVRAWRRICVHCRRRR